MNKLVKGSIAGAAGIALLLGGAGTFALWNDSANIAGATVTTGALSLTSAGDGDWSNDAAVLVPGESTTYTETFNIVATGDNISATLTPTYSDVTADGITTTTSVTVAGETAAGTVYTLDEGTYVATVTVTVSFDAEDQDHQGVSKSVGVVSLELQQLAV